jgi:hypothetical protein
MGECQILTEVKFCHNQEWNNVEEGELKTTSNPKKTKAQKQLASSQN